MSCSRVILFKNILASPSIVLSTALTSGVKSYPLSALACPCPLLTNSRSHVRSWCKQPVLDALSAYQSWYQYLWGGSGSCCYCFFFSVPAVTPALHLSAVKNQSLPFWADAKAAEEDNAVRCESPRGGAGGQAEGGYEWREEGEEEEDEEEEDEEEEAWREEEEEEEEE
uniref:Uncharacterized protein n=1 Tax=Chromera velia CCMP2878 TaxID=1169474 RepID=A0A0G4I7N3_9ALVE|eukprot:Cvel_11723.t2-p1 / transcript=Cvel_11723.t2 / gene=Cvel_11723 / organism=Chromera_velia_CCMP2878 / gene_product=hypothetical protein / transcript_product=hypothetical protein / location=Cvel_scaffold744:7325-9010(-) / protein_length=168 / sequence_SO=supercontig / SO=protein_coding / is_pseudo=false